MNIIKIGFVSALLINSQFNLNAQNKIEFSEVIEVEGANKDALYSKGLIWFAETFNDSRAVIEAKDREAGMIIGNGFFEYTAPAGLKYTDVHGHIEFTVKVMFKDGRTKIDLTSFTHKPNYSGYSLGTITDSDNYSGKRVHSMLSDKWHQDLWQHLRKDIDGKAKVLIENFRKFIVDNSTETDEW